MKLFILRISIVFALTLLPLIADARCFGSSSVSTCQDDEGNTYTVSHFGNTTVMQGNNSETDSDWSQTSRTIGKTTYTSGDTNGNEWDMQQTNIGNMKIINGTNADGESFSYACTQYGGCTGSR